MANEILEEAPNRSPEQPGEAMQSRRGDVGRPTRPRGPAREIAVAVTLKLVALGVIYALFFSPSQRPAVDAERVRETVIGPVSTAPSSVPQSTSPQTPSDEVRP
ncbi:cytochrome oxidase putative small subunit CydP [Hypericibacter sp.]|uniref:cytochrome oxidase putative small subunit CydP n=1 Tax=Hypericibacter sp. TaxID=2705401 RepID=UPI003D6D1C7E